MIQGTITVEITTLPQLHKAIRHAKEILVQPRFGCSEAWIPVSKKAARELIAQTVVDANATPDHLEMYTGTFGSVVGNTLYLG